MNRWVRLRKKMMRRKLELKDLSERELYVFRAQVRCTSSEGLVQSLCREHLLELVDIELDRRKIAC